MLFSGSTQDKFKEGKPLLRVWDGDFGIPSIQPESLQIWAYVKINKIEIDVEKSTFPYLRPIPCLIHNNRTFSDMKTIWEKLRELKPSNTDELYDVAEQSRIKAYISYVIEYLETAFVINFWVNERNYVNFTRTWFRNAVYFPFNRFYIKKVKDSMDKHIKFLARDHSVEDFSTYEYKKAQKCLDDLSKLLDNKSYFMGDTPTTLDAYVFGYLSPLLLAPLPENNLQNYVKGCPNLVRFVRSMTKTFFPGTKEESKYIIKTTNENDDEASTKMIVAAGLFAFTAMFAYATMIGQLKFQK